MTPNAQRIAIARACPTVARVDGAGAPVWIRDPSEYFDPLEDLNAMHEAEKVLTPEQRSQYVLLLRDGTEPTKLDFLARDFASHHATAAARVEAFLRTLGKWQ